MILCQQIERLSPHLKSVSQLMEEYAAGNIAFPELALKWLDDAEKQLASLRVSGSSELATLKGRVLRAADGLHTGDEKPARSKVRSARNVAAMDALQRGEEILRGTVIDAEERLQRFEDKLCEGMTALALQVEIPSRSIPMTEWLGVVWMLLLENAATRPLATYLATSLSVVDRLFLLDTVLSRLQAPLPSE
ncbi:MAG: hypothetical protein H7840_03300 [Alphaproteobacteria bacterium]